jgi:hypothetical protein
MTGIPLYHHVYSSLEGYKTLFSSRTLPEQIVQKLDVFSTETYDKIPAACPREIFFTEEGYVCISKKFVNGSDHVGRTRSCVHNVLIRQQDVYEAPFFNPFSIPDALFLNADSDLMNIAGLVHKSWTYSEGDFVDSLAALGKSALPQPQLKEILLAVLSGKSSCVVRGASRPVIEALEMATAALPPSLRERFSLVAFYPLKPLVSTGGVFTAIVLGKSEPVNDFIRDGFIVIDLAEKMSYNLEPKNAYAELIMDALFRPGALPNLVKLLKVLETYRISSVLSPAHYEALIKAWKQTVDAFTPAGQIDVAANHETALDSVLDFYKAGYWSIASDIVEKCFHMIMSNQYFRAFEPRRAEQVALFIKFMKDALGDKRHQDKTIAISVQETKETLELMEKQNRMRVSEDVADFDI